MKEREKNMTITELDQAYVAGTYKRFPVEIVSGKGSILTDSQGKSYVDLGSGIGVTAFGIGDESWIQAVTDQLGQVQHTSNLYYTEPCARLARELCQCTGMSRVFFGNSGAEANECAIKVARKYSAEKKGKDCFTIVTMKNSFHGRTLTTLAATGQEHYHELFNPLTPGFVSVEAGNPEEMENLISTGKVAGVLMECIQGEGGVVPLPGEYIRRVREMTLREDIPLMIDEVQTGNGRTGKLYSYMNFDIVPDLFTTAKGLGGGLPLGAAVMNEKLAHVLGYGDHGSTFGGNPVCCAGALSVLNRLGDAFLEEVREKSRQVFQSLSGAPGIEGVSGLGLMIGIKTTRPAGDVVSECIREGVLCLTAKDRVRLLPALNIPTSTLLDAVETIKKVCARG